MTDKHVASLIIVGDEILRGQVQDANTMYLAKSLQSIGIKLRRVVVISDEVDAIAAEVSEASKRYPLVFTSGGVGPTHDDVTYEGVAQALGLSLGEDPVLLERLTRLHPEQPEVRRLATVPQPCELVNVDVKAPGDRYAVVKAGNVYVLPGSPRYFRPAVDTIVRVSLEAGERPHTESLDIDLDEFALVECLDRQAERYRGTVSIGSYPQPTAQPRTRITLEGASKEVVAQARKDIEAMLPRETMHHDRLHREFDAEYAKRVHDSREELEHVARAFAILEECYDKYKSNEVFLSFNGGKDCTVILHLAATFAKIRKQDPPLCLYVLTGDAFPEVEEFVQQAANYYGFELIRRAGPIREALASLLAERPNLRACLLGTRKGDPGAHSLEPLAPTDPGWPVIMRVSPIIDWTYSQVWQFLLRHEVPYCTLYDQGYTSLGARDTTTKNPLLRDPNNPSVYLPAYTLADDSTERQGRG